MKNLVLVAALVVAPFAVAHETDEIGTSMSPAQIAKAQDLPGTTVIRVSKTDPSKVEVAYLKESLPKGADLSKVKFQTLALNAEQTGIAYDVKTELDATSSTSSWSFWYGNSYPAYRPNYVRPYYYNPAYYSSYYNPSYTGYGYNPYYYGNYYYRPSTYAYVNPYYYPTYRYAGYSYAYTPYDDCADSNYAYVSYRWMY